MKRNSKTSLGAYYRRISYPKGASVAVLPRLVNWINSLYRLVRYGQAYVDTDVDAYESRFNKRCLKSYTNALK